jgi:glucose-1-phosphate thymidylyltransferase
MKLIIPMAGMGKRMRPHTLTIPKPLIHIAGKPIVQRLIEDIAKTLKDKITDIGFVIGNFGPEIEQQLISIAEKVGAKGKIFYQQKALGTAHAILCAEELLDEKVTIAFADTLFKANFIIDETKEAIIWTQKVKDPKSFGVVKVDKNNFITDFIEKPVDFISDMAIIGIYYFKDGQYLKKELQYLIDNNILKGDEFQLTDALENMKTKGTKFSMSEVEEWLDCGNKNATVFTNKRILEIDKSIEHLSKTVKINNSVIINPCFIDENVHLNNSIIGPYVSIGENTIIENSIIKNSIVQTNSKIVNALIENSMIGNYVEYMSNTNDVSIGDYTTIN